MELQILKERTLDACFAAFSKLPKSHQFETGFQILSWLQDGLLQPTDRLAGIFILLEYSKSSENNVFLSSIAEIIDHTQNYQEKILLQEWFRNKELGKMTPADAMKLSGEVRDLDHIKRAISVRPIVNGGTKEPVKTLFGRFEVEFLRPIPDFMEITPQETQ